MTQRTGERYWILILAALLFSALCARAEPGVSDHEIVIGSCAPLSGPNKDLGIAEMAGANAFLDYVNLKGGVHGRQIRVVSYDDRYEVDEAIACFHRLMEEEVFAGAFFTGAPTGLKYVQMAEANRVPIVGITSGGKFLYQPFKRYVLTTRATFRDETYAEVEHAWNELGARRIAVVYQNDAFGAAGLEGINEALTSHDAEPIQLAAIDRNSMNVSPAVEKLRASRPDVVFLLITYGPAAEFVKDASKIGWRPRFVLMAGRKSFLESAGPAAEGTIWASLLPPTNDASRPAVALYRKLVHGEGRDDSKTMEGFVHAMILVEGLKRAGPNLTRERLVDAVESIRDVDLGLGADYTFHFSPTNHQGFKTIHFVVVQGGKPVPLRDWKKLKKT